jgi:hypothetical protein
MSTTPSQPTKVLGTDEDVLIHAGSDYALLAYPWEQLAAGADGVFLSSDPWTLTSATIDFEAHGVAANNVVQLTKPASLYGSGGHFLAVESVSGRSVTLRRPYKAPGVGQPPAPASGQTAVTFECRTFAAMLAEATYDLYQRFGLDENVGAVGIQRSPGWVYDLQVFRAACVYWVLLERYTQEGRTSNGDFTMKIARFKAKLDDAIGRITVQFGPQGNSQESTSIFSCRLVR